MNKSFFLFLSDVSKSCCWKLDPHLNTADTCFFQREVVKTWRIKSPLHSSLAWFTFQWLWFTSWMTIVYTTKKHAFGSLANPHNLLCAVLPLGCCLSLNLIHVEILSLNTSVLLLLLLLVDMWQTRELPACLHLSWWVCQVRSPSPRGQTNFWSWSDHVQYFLSDTHSDVTSQILWEWTCVCRCIKAKIEKFELQPHYRP